MKSVLRLLPALALAACCNHAVEPPSDRPNFLVILTDDVGWGDYQCYNPQGKVPSPNVDRLAREGMRFTHAHSPAALCAPSRYSMLTGNYPWRGRAALGTWGFNVPSQILPGQKTIANILQEAGYRTAMFGKSGTGGLHASRNGQPDLTRPMVDGPRRWGFYYSFIIPRGHQHEPRLFLENELPTCPVERLVPGEVGSSDPDWNHSEVGERLLAQAERFLDDCSAQDARSGTRRPFFIHFCTDGAHEPYVPPARLRGVPVLGHTRMTEHTDMVWQTDVLLGGLVEMLERRGLRRNTLICFTSDNGGIPTEREFGHDGVGGLHGSKSEIWEGGHRVPFVVSWGDGTAAGSRIPPGTFRTQPIGAHDIVASMAELAGAPPQADQMLDSVSLVPVVLGRTGDDRPVRTRLLVQSCPGRDAFSEGTWSRDARRLPKLTTTGGAKRQPSRRAKSSDGMAHAVYDGNWKLVMDIGDRPAALYDLSRDLGERSNLIDEPRQADRVAALEATYRALRGGNRSTPVVAGSAPRN